MPHARELCVQCGTSLAQAAEQHDDSVNSSNSSKLILGLPVNDTWTPNEAPYIYETPGPLILVLLALVPLVGGMVLCAHANRRRRQGHTHMLWDAIDIRLPQRAVAPAVRSQACEQIEESTLQAVARLPSSPWDGIERGECSGECTLCIEPFQTGELVTRLPSCTHTFHKECLERWFVHGQRYKKRRCPLCNVDPFAPSSTPAASTPAAAEVALAAADAEAPSPGQAPAAPQA